MRETEIYFCLDKSGSMINEIDMIKDAVYWLYTECKKREISKDYFIIPVSDRPMKKFLLND